MPLSHSGGAAPWRRASPTAGRARAAPGADADGPAGATTVAPVPQARLEHELAIIGRKGFADYFLVVRDIVAARAHPLRPRLGRQLDRELLPRHHPRRAARRGAPVRALPQSRAQGPARHRSRLPLGRARRRAGLRVPPLSPSAGRDGGQPQLLPPARRAARGGQGARPSRRRDPRGHPPHSLSSRTGRRSRSCSRRTPTSRRSTCRRAGRSSPGMAAPLVGLPRHLSLHPGGVVIVPTALTDYVPIEPAVKTLDGQSRTSTGARHPVREGRRRGRGAGQDRPARQPLAGRDPRRHRRGAARTPATRSTTPRPTAGEDEPTKALFRTGQTMGVFYTESPASRLLCAKSRADTFELLVLNTSIIRPASNRYIRVYLERLHGAPYEPLDPGAARHAGRHVRRHGLPGGRGERLRHVRRHAARHRRRAPQSRSPRSARPRRSPATPRSSSPARCALGRDPETTKRVWEMIMSFAGYSFCKGHSAPTSRWRSTPATSGPTIRPSSWRRCWPTAAGSTTRSPTWRRPCGWDSRCCRPTSTRASSAAPARSGSSGSGCSS